jgi:peptidoglycan/xylan/chitin deacetylase (PgdA/CDA1 family)
VSEGTIALIYHDVVDSADRERAGMPGPVAARYKLAPELFREHLDALAATGRSVGVLAPDRPWPEAALTFDDGGASSLFIAGLLEERGWRGHFFATTGFVGTPGFLDEEGIRELAARGHVVGSHSHSHPQYMGRLSREQLDEEWGRSRDELAGILGEPPRQAAIPGGYFSHAVAEAAEAAGYRLLLTSEPSSRPHRVGELVYMGRYTIWSTTAASTAAAYVSRSPLARGRLLLEWKLKQGAKRASPAAYRTLQRLRSS